ncbi:uncharacterized protein LOC129950936 isoform X2 [Eupeodes corollae]|uniref:uncharacterized protein LOC129950936 isoform X2 n=1 Tax=Eupeodes corollae TaxID=290404 RepID=UPI0024901439|nr:uncharacterized protein LOC129950936 isoform X2 [Eupeodes corollae]
MYTFRVVWCVVFIFCVSLVNCLTNLTSNTTTVTVTTTTKLTDVQRPQLSTLDKYLRSEKSFAIVNGGRNSDNTVGVPLNEISGLQNVTSQNYPRPYPVPKIVKQRLSVDNSIGLDIIINDLDIDPTSDYISLTPLNTDGSEGRPIILTGKLKEPLSIRSLGFTRANLIFEARTVGGHSFRGFSISYAPYGEVREPSTQPPDYTLSYDQLQTSSKLLVVAKNDQTSVTWNRFKEIMAQSANSYIAAEKLTLEKATPENVTLTRVAECFESWPDSENCIELEFAITLYNDSSLIPTIVDPYLEDLTPREPAGMSDLQLELMWDKFGRSAFQESGIREYELPDTRSQILKWVGIAIGVCVLMFLVLVAVFRSPAFRDRWVEDDEVAIKPKEETNKVSTVDITMYPSPDQIIPEMYPGYQTGGVSNNSHNRPTINEENKGDEDAKNNNNIGGITTRTAQSQPE